MSNETNAKVALVFGGSRGIGAAAALRLAQDGFAVALTYVSRPDAAAQTVAAIEAGGGQALAIEADSADADAIRRAVAATVDRFGPLDAVVINAGVLHMASIEGFAIADFDRMLDVNVRGVFLAIQAAVAQMRDGGRVITIGSNTGAGLAGARGSGVYAMTKAAVATLVKGAALDLAPRGITVNNIQPGPTETDMTRSMMSALVARIPLGRGGQPAEIGALVSYLAGPESSYMTGSSLTIDGGYML